MRWLLLLDTCQINQPYNVLFASSINGPFDTAFLFLVCTFNVPIMHCFFSLWSYTLSRLKIRRYCFFDPAPSLYGKVTLCNARHSSIAFVSRPIFFMFVLIFHTKLFESCLNAQPKSLPQLLSVLLLPLES